MTKRVICFSLIACALLSACGQAAEKQREREEITAALKKYVDQQPGFEKETADRSVRLFNTDRDRAEVVVEFKSRTDGALRLMIYHLRRQGDEWVVVDARPYAPRPS